jgi:Mrp family chromosome partitioning ATPase
LERIQRALELARLQRSTVNAADVALEEAAAPFERAATARVGRIPSAENAARTVSISLDTLRERRIIMPNDPVPAAHAYRMLRTQLLRQARANRLRMIGVVSCADGEGKTLTAVNLALSIAAEPNQTVLLVDLDLRRPSIARLLGLDVLSGLDAWFENGDLAVADLFVKLEGIERLRVLPALYSVTGSSEALAGARTHELLTELKTRYTDRVVILDLPPALLTDDVLTVAPMLDGVLLVVSEGRTRREDVARARELLGSVRILGTVLNLASESEKRTY